MLLNREICYTLKEAQILIERWRQEYNTVRPHSALGYRLGLAICREVVRAHRGTIWLDSVPGQGSTFTFTIPTVG